MERQNNKAFWWGKTIVVLMLASLFLMVGIGMFFSTYLLKNPLEFIMAFFSSSLIVLISLVGLIYSGFRIYQKIIVQKRESGF